MKRAITAALLATALLVTPVMAQEATPYPVIEYKSLTVEPGITTGNVETPAVAMTNDERFNAYMDAPLDAKEQAAETCEWVINGAIRYHGIRVSDLPKTAEDTFTMLGKLCLAALAPLYSPLYEAVGEVIEHPDSNIPNGMWTVGTVGGQVHPGIYQSPGGTDQYGCYVATKDHTGGIIDNELVDEGPVVIVVTEEALAVEVSDCRPFIRISKP